MDNKSRSVQKSGATPHNDARTQAYVAKRETEGKNRKEIIRCLKRHIAREIYRLITNPPPTPDYTRLRARRQHAGITITQAAQQLRTRPARISELELGRNHNHQLATQYHNWLRTRQPAPLNRPGFPGDSIGWEIMESWED